MGKFTPMPEKVARPRVAVASKLVRPCGAEEEADEDEEGVEEEEEAVESRAAAAEDAAVTSEKDEGLVDVGWL